MFKKKKINIRDMDGFRMTSKAALKMQILILCKGDLDEANKLYDYFSKDMPELPDYDPIQPTWMDNTKDTVNGLMAWFKENQDTLAQGYEFIKGVVQKREMPTVVSSEPLPDINE